MEAIGDGALLHARTDPLSNKVKRIRDNPHVRVALSDLSGKPKGSWFDGEARLVDGDAHAEAIRAFRKEYGAVRYTLVNLVGRMRGQRLSSVMSIRLDSTPSRVKE